MGASSKTDPHKAAKKGLPHGEDFFCGGVSA